jgi:hypothetical protein
VIRGGLGGGSRTIDEVDDEAAEESESEPESELESDPSPARDSESSTMALLCLPA